MPMLGSLLRSLSLDVRDPFDLLPLTFGCLTSKSSVASSFTDDALVFLDARGSVVPHDLRVLVLNLGTPITQIILSIVQDLACLSRMSVHGLLISRDNRRVV